MDNVVKLDMFEYELEDIGGDPYDKYASEHPSFSAIMLILSSLGFAVPFVYRLAIS